VLVGFKGQLMHVFNKNKFTIPKLEHLDKLSHRDNILLMGDSLGDLNMAEGAVDNANLLTVGFLNDKVT
jgi:cytosolic 5'-nucleotidase 3